MEHSKIFTTHPKPLMPLPNLAEVQLNSYRWLIEKGLRELFDEISPVRDYTGKDLELKFLNYFLDEPKITEAKAKADNLTYETALRVRVELQNKRTGEIKEQEIYLGEFPLMTPRGTFIVNGVERVVVSQLIRSAGTHFIAVNFRGRKLFGAKLIPNRGAWLEFETDPEGAIHVKIDRKRKIAVSALLRIFGLESDEEIRRAFAERFKDGDPNYITYINATLKEDASKNKDEAFIEIYRRIRPGDPATVDNARSLIGPMFFRLDRYDLGEVGRYKMNKRLGLKFPIDRKHRILQIEDLVAVVSEIIRLNLDPSAKADDIDHLGNRRVRAVGELLQNRMRVGLARMRRIIQDRMSTLDLYTLTPAQLINARPLIAVVRDFLMSSQLSQFMDQINPLSELEHKRRVSAMGPGGLTRERAGFEVRDVHSSHYGRICPIQTPEGPNIGLVGHLASFSRLNDYGFIESPYIKVKNGRITSEIVWLDAYEEEQYVIAHGGVKYDDRGRILEELVEVRRRGEPGIAHRNEVQLIDVSPQQSISVATALIPFLEHDDATRALMGANMQRQAVPCIKNQAPLVSSGFEERAARDSGQVVIAEEDGTVVEVDAEKIVIREESTGAGPTKDSKKSRMKTYPLIRFLRTNQFTCINQRPIVKPGQKIKKGDVLADSSATENGVLALGQNVLTAFLSWGGANFEDAIVISERLVKDDRFTSIHIEDFTVDVRDTKLGPEITTPDIPNVAEEKLKDLDEEGIVRIGAEVEENDILVGKITPKGEADLTAEERLLRAIFGEKAKDVKDTSLRLEHGKRGRVIGIKVFSRDKGDKLEPGVIKRIQVEVAQLRKITVGDKLAGRHGNKGVISKILPEEDMPYLEDGTPVDIVLNPLGVVSRMNIGQILETHLGWAAAKLGYRAISPALAGATEKQIKEELKKAGFKESGQTRVFDGRTGELLGEQVTVGYMYKMKLIHLVEDKIHMRSIGPYSLITQQPLGGKAQFGGQRFGEMEVWALEGYGAAYTLQELLTMKSDDVLGRASAYEAIIRGESIKPPNVPASFNVLVNELKALGLSVELIGEKKEIIEEQ